MEGMRCLLQGEGAEEARVQKSILEEGLWSFPESTHVKAVGSGSVCRVAIGSFRFQYDRNSNLAIA